MFQVCHKTFPNYYFALKIAEVAKVMNMKREADIFMEKHTLNKLSDKYGVNSPSVKLVATFKDQFQLYFLTEMLKSRDEVWAHCRSFGFLQESVARLVFKNICLQVQKMHSENLIHRDLKPENMFFSNLEKKEIMLIDMGSSDDLNDP